MSEALEQGTYLQQLMDEAYKSFKSNVRYQEWFNTLDLKHQQAVLVGNTNQQVCNGGWSQLKMNYMPGDMCNGTWDDNQLETFTSLMDEINTPACQLVKDMFTTVFEAEYVEDSEEVEVGEEWDEELQDYVTEYDTEYSEHWEYNGHEVELEALDSPFYEINDDWIEEVSEYLRTGEVTIKAKLQEDKVEGETTDSKPGKPVLKLTGVDGNAFMLLGVARKVAVRHNMDWDKIQAEATAGDYNHLLRVLMNHFEVV